MLKETLNAMKAASAEKIPAETLAVMQKAKEDLAASGIMDRAVKIGDQIADFTLADAHGAPISLASLRQTGPVVLTIYRGVW
jgi:hypothetical protein